MQNQSWFGYWRTDFTKQGRESVRKGQRLELWGQRDDDVREMVMSEIRATSFTHISEVWIYSQLQHHDPVIWTGANERTGWHTSSTQYFLTAGGWNWRPSSLNSVSLDLISFDRNTDGRWWMNPAFHRRDGDWWHHSNAEIPAASVTRTPALA